MNVTVAGAPILVYMLASTRIVAWLLIAPPFSNRAIPVMAKVVMSLGLALVAVPQTPMSSLPQTNGGVILVMLTQVLVGVMLGFITMLLFQSIATAGALIDQFAGMTLTSAFDPLDLTQNSIFGRLHQALAVALMFATGAHLLVIGGLLRTFRVLPVTSTFSSGTFTIDTVLTAFRLFLVTAVEIALPLVAVLFVADLGLALLTKVAPQLNAMTLMFPAKIALTLMLVGLTFPALIPAVERLTDLVVRAMAHVTGGG